jgi:hypothetical protein
MGLPKMVRAKLWLLDLYKQRKRKSPKTCLHDVRAALGSVGLKLPWRPFPWNTAFENFKVLAADPEKYGWKQVHNPLDQYGVVLVYFKDCGRLTDGRTAGHISLFDTQDGWHYANDSYRMTKSWSSKIVGAFVPVDP